MRMSFVTSWSVRRDPRSPKAAIPGEGGTLGFPRVLWRFEGFGQAKYGGISPNAPQRKYRDFFKLDSAAFSMSQRATTNQTTSILPTSLWGLRR